MDERTTAVAERLYRQIREHDAEQAMVDAEPGVMSAVAPTGAGALVVVFG